MRGQYRTIVGQDLVLQVAKPGHSVLTWVVGGLALGGAVLWARHKSQQLAKLYAATGHTPQSFGAGLRADVRALPKRAEGALHKITHRLGAGKEK